MTAHDAVRLVAAFVITLGLVLANVVHPAWLALSGFVGLNLFQFSFSGFCPALSLLKLAGLRPETDPSELAALRKAQIVFGVSILVVAAVGYFAPAPALAVATAVGGVMALSFGQSAVTRKCPALALGRRWSRA
jgi:hypothetical protein